MKKNLKLFIAVIFSLFASVAALFALDFGVAAISEIQNGNIRAGIQAITICAGYLSGCISFVFLAHRFTGKI